MAVRNHALCVKGVNLKCGSRGMEGFGDREASISKKINITDSLTTIEMKVKWFCQG